MRIFNAWYFYSWYKNQDGQAVVELSLLLPIYLIILFGMMVIGYWLVAQQVVNVAAREGAKVGALTNDNVRIETAIYTVISTLSSNRSRTAITIAPPQSDDALRQRSNPLTVTVTFQMPVVFTTLSSAFAQVSSQAVSRMEFVP